VFERYTEKARRAIFFARYEASVYGSPQIETEHLLLGLLREDMQFVAELRTRGATEDAVRNWIDSKVTPGPKVSTSVDLPVSQEGIRVLTYAAEESESLGQSFVGTAHLVLGLLREPQSLAGQCLAHFGVALEPYRTIARATTPEEKRHDPITETRHARPDRIRPVEAPLPTPKASSLSAPIAAINRQLGLEFEQLDPDQRLKRKPWTRKEAMGHLIDLATAHQQLLARALTEPAITVVGYPSDDWVTAQHYNDHGWYELLSLWILINRLLMHVIAQVPEGKLALMCRTGVAAPVPLSAVIERYVVDCEDLLGQILAKLD
jgi:hypothetical protein